MAVQMLYPFAPHLGEELWQRLGQKEQITYALIPAVNPKYLIEKIVTYVVQINGKLRGRFELPMDQSEEELLAFVKEEDEVKKHLVGEIVKTVFVPNKLLNIVTKS